MIYILFQIISAWLFADFATGITHWVEDRYLTPFMVMPWWCKLIEPFLRESAIANNRHHYSPIFMTYFGFYETIKAPLMIEIPLIIICWFFNSLFNPFAITFFVLTTLSNEFHRYSHIAKSKTSPIILFLQKYWIIVNRENHNEHHKNGINDYCATSGIMNGFLNFINFWNIIEHLIYLSTGIKAGDIGTASPNKENEDETNKIMEKYNKETIKMLEQIYKNETT